MFCSISGSTPKEPVLSSTGFVFERRLLEEHIKTHQACPVTNQPLTNADITVINVNRAVKPRVAATSSIPALLQTFQNEWDALMVETFELRKQLDGTRKELSAALYRQDASERVIARLLQERDQARAKVAGVALQNGQSTDQKPMDVDSEEEETVTLFNDEQEQLISDKTEELVAWRREGETYDKKALTSKDVVGKFSESSSISVFSGKKKQVVLLSLKNDSNVVAAGSDSGAIRVFDYVKETKGETLSSHKKPITGLEFASSDVLVSSSREPLVNVWKNTNNKGFKVVHTFDKNNLHTKDVVGVSVHPTEAFFVSASKDNSWGVSDLRTGENVYMNDSSDSAFTDVEFHPDGMLIGTVDASNALTLWDIKSSKSVFTLAKHSGLVGALKFSNNGYFIATGSNDKTVKLWDLRNLEDPILVDLEQNSAVKCVAFDASGNFLAVGGKDVNNFAVADDALNALGRLTGHSKQVNSVVFGANAASLLSGSNDGLLKIWK